LGPVGEKVSGKISIVEGGVDFLPVGGRLRKDQIAFTGIAANKNFFAGKTVFGRNRDVLASTAHEDPGFSSLRRVGMPAIYLVYSSMVVNPLGAAFQRGKRVFTEQPDRLSGRRR
jgi:hypothetical protein